MSSCSHLRISTANALVSKATACHVQGTCRKYPGLSSLISDSEGAAECTLATYTCCFTLQFNSTEEVHKE